MARTVLPPDQYCMESVSNSTRLMLFLSDVLGKLLMDICVTDTKTLKCRLVSNVWVNCSERYLLYPVHNNRLQMQILSTITITTWLLWKSEMDIVREREREEESKTDKEKRKRLAKVKVKTILPVSHKTFNTQNFHKTWRFSPHTRSTVSSAVTKWCWLSQVGSHFCGKLILISAWGSPWSLLLASQLPLRSQTSVSHLLAKNSGLLFSYSPTCLKLFAWGFCRSEKWQGTMLDFSFVENYFPFMCKTNSDTSIADIYAEFPIIVIMLL